MQSLGSEASCLETTNGTGKGRPLKKAPKCLETRSDGNLGGEVWSLGSEASRLETTNRTEKGRPPKKAPHCLETRNDGNLGGGLKHLETTDGTEKGPMSCLS